MDKAASLLHKSRSDFMLKAGCMLPSLGNEKNCG
ncbi:MAG: hypothetical protein H0U70_10545 [Tatlockia sp.]|nr:hypothetical protein [Tatlockia sp.]